MLGVSKQVGSVGRYFDRSVQVGPEHLRADAFEPGQGFRGWVAVVVVRTGTDHRYPRTKRLDQAHRRRRAAAVVRDLEDVELRADAIR